MNITDITKQIRAFADQLESTQTTPPFQLPPPPPGMQWHRKDGWKAEDLPPGTRPLVTGEKRQLEDDWVGSDKKLPWRKCRVSTLVSSHSTEFYRTSRPLVFEHAGKSWTYHRPGDPMPCDGEAIIEIVCIGGRTTDSDGDPLHSRRAKANMWRITIGWRYAEPLTREVELGPEDVPPMTLLRGGGEVGSKGWCLITSCSETGVRIWRHSEAAGHEITWQRLRESESQINRPKHRDADGNPTLWEKCSKEVPA